MKRYITPIILVFLLIKFTFGIPLNLKFQHLTISNGLSNNKVNDVLQDSSGYIWIATSDGLNRFDGYDVKLFHSEIDHPENLNNDNVTKLYLTRKNCLLVGTFGGGLNVYDHKTQNFEHFLLADSASFNYQNIKSLKKLTSFSPQDEKTTDDDTFFCYSAEDVVAHSILNNYITDIIEDTKGNIWFGSSGGGLGKYDPITKKFKHFLVHRDENYNIPGTDVVNCISLINDNLMLVSSGIGLFYFNMKNEVFDHVFEMKNAMVTAIEIDDLGNIWIGTSLNGLFQLDKHFDIINHFTKTNSLLEDNYIVSLKVEKNGIIWIGTETAGLYRYSLQKKQFQNYRANISDINSLTHNSVLSIFLDNSGILWAGTYSGGVNFTQVEGQKFQHYYLNNTNKGVNDNRITSFCEPNKNTIWIGTDGGGINILDRTTGIFEYLTTDKNSRFQLSSNFIMHLLFDNEQNIWVSTYNGGINKINLKTNTIKIYNSENKSGLPTNIIRNIFQDSSGNILVAASDFGILQYDSKNDSFFFPSKLDQINKNNTYNYFNSIYEDSYGNYWFATLSSGLYRYNKYTEITRRYFKDLQVEQPQLSNNIHEVFEDNQKNVWICTEDGLFEYNDLNKNCELMNILPAHKILAIEQDKTGNLWLSTSKGLSFLNIQSNQIKNYFESDGLQSSQFNVNSSFTDSNGNLYFGGINGFNIFSPETVAKKPESSKVIITDFKIFNKSVNYKENPDIINLPIDYAEEINLSYKDYLFSFTFSSTNYFNNKNTTYKYILAGFDNQWHKTDNTNTAIYTNIPPGTYTFEVNTCENDMLKCVGKTIQLHISPPFWKTIWFYFIIAATLSYTIFSFIKYRIRTITKRNEELYTSNLRSAKELEKRKKIEEELAKAKALLEIKVEERTAELQEVNEQLLNAVEAAEKADKAKSTFLANMSHEIRTPLNAIIGFSELLTGMVTNSVEQSYLNSIKVSGKSLLTLINDILDLSKIDSGNFQIEYEPVKVADILQEIKMIFEKDVVEKNLEFYLKVDNSLPEFLELDETRFRQILINLVGNAIKFTDAGHIKISIKKQRLDKTADILVSVTDTGIGIPEEDQKIIFDSFRQREGQSTRKYGGTGLGLNICKKLIEMMNGSIFVESKLGEGSTFSFCLREIKLPDKNVSREIETEDSNFDIQFNPANILIVDDVQSNIKLIDTLLKKKNFTTIAAINGEEAIIIAKISLPDLIIMDLHMPVMDGYSATKILKNNEDTKHIPVIASSASPLIHGKNVKEITLFDGFVPKPINNSVLCQTLRKYLPYEKSEIIKEAKPEILQSREIIDIQEFISIINNNIIPKAHDIMDSMIISDIADINDELIELSEKHHADDINLQCQKLKESIEQFDIENIERHLKQLTSMLKNI